MLDPGKGRHGMIGNIMYPAGAGRRETDWQVNIVNGQVISARLVMRVNGMLRMSDNLAALLHDETLDNMKTLLGDSRPRKPSSRASAPRKSTGKWTGAPTGRGGGRWT